MIKPFLVGTLSVLIVQTESVKVASAAPVRTSEQEQDDDFDFTNPFDLPAERPSRPVKRAPAPAQGGGTNPSGMPLPIRKPKLYQIPFKSMCGFFRKPTPLVAAQAPLAQKIDLLLVSKDQRKLVVFSGTVPLKEYQISLGFTPVGAKQQRGDGKTPEGQYFIEYKNPGSRYYKSLKVSYPNAKDEENAKRLGVSPGDDIMIHGESNKPENVEWVRGQIKEKGRFDWTWGCVAVQNEQIDEIYRFAAEKTSVEICP